MIAYRVYSALFTSLFAAILTMTAFSRIRRYEQTAKLRGGSWDYYDFLWFAPVLMAALVLGAALRCALCMGAAEGAAYFIGKALEFVIELSVFYALMRLFLPLLRRYFSAQTCSWLWMLPCVLLFLTMRVADRVTRESSTLFAKPLTLPVSARTLYIIGAVWLTGAVLVLVGQFVSHKRFRRAALIGAEWETDERLLRLWEEAQKEADLMPRHRLVRAPAVSSPTVIGLRQSKQHLFLPPADYTDAELALIFRHELWHLRRNDVYLKLFWAICRALCWFDPLMWSALRQSAQDVEQANDEAVLRDADDETRRRYAALLLHTGDDRGFTTCLSAEGKSLKRRVELVLHPQEKRGGVFLMALLAAVIVLFSGFVRVAGVTGTAGELVWPELAGEAKLETVVVDTDAVRTDNPAAEWLDIDTVRLCPDDIAADALLAYMQSLAVSREAKWTQYPDTLRASLELMYPYGRIVLLPPEPGMSGEGELLVSNKRGGVFYWRVESEIDWDYIAACLNTK